MAIQKIPLLKFDLLLSCTDNRVIILTLILATEGGDKNTPSAVFAESRIVSNGMRQLFFRHYYRPLWLFDATEYIVISTSGFTSRFDSNIHVTGFATTSIVRP